MLLMPAQLIFRSASFSSVRISCLISAGSASKSFDSMSCLCSSFSSVCKHRKSTKLQLTCGFCFILTWLFLCLYFYVVFFPSFILSVCITACMFLTWLLNINQSINQSITRKTEAVISTCIYTKAAHMTTM